MSPLDLTIRAKTYIDKLSNGINPITNVHVTETDSVNNTKVSNALSYISKLLNRIIDYCTMDYSTDPRKAFKGLRPFFISEEQISRYIFSNEPVYLSTIARQLNSLSHAPDMKEITCRNLLSYLFYTGCVEEKRIQKGEILRRPTAKGLEIGLIQLTRKGSKGPNTVTLYTAPAQHYIITHIQPIIAFLATRHVEHPDPNKPIKPDAILPAKPADLP